MDLLKISELAYAFVDHRPRGMVPHPRPLAQLMQMRLITAIMLTVPFRALLEYQRLGMLFGLETHSVLRLPQPVVSW